MIIDPVFALFEEIQPGRWLASSLLGVRLIMARQPGASNYKLPKLLFTSQNGPVRLPTSLWKPKLGAGPDFVLMFLTVLRIFHQGWHCWAVLIPRLLSHRKVPSCEQN
jgi:hypothetical protein